MPTATKPKQKKSVKTDRASARIMHTADAYQHNARLFIQRVLGDTPTRKQAAILKAISKPRAFVAVKSANGVGKTWLAARIGLWFLFSFPRSLVITTATTWHQVSTVLWREIHSAIREAPVNLGDFSENVTSISLDSDWSMFGLSTNEEIRFQGHHAPHLLMIFDEAPGIAQEIWDAARGILRGLDPRWLVIGNPLARNGEFYRCFSDSDWVNFSVSAFESPNVVADRIVAPGLVTAKDIERDKRRWGENSSIYQSRVLGEFPNEDILAVIPMGFVELMQQRQEETKDKRGLNRWVGIDVGTRNGPDPSTFVIRDEWRVLHLESHVGWTTPQVRRRGTALAKEFNVPARNVFVDDIGIGGGVTDEMRDSGCRVKSFVASERATDSDHFANAKAEAWWRTRQAVENDTGFFAFDASLFPELGERLKLELTTCLYSTDNRGRIVVESKEDVKGRLGHSPDLADALVMTFSGGKPRTGSKQKKVGFRPGRSRFDSNTTRRVWNIGSTHEH